MTRLPAHLPASLLKLNPHLAGDATPARGARRANALDAQRVAGCPPSEREALAREADARSHHIAQGKAAHAHGQAFERAVADELDALLLTGVLADYQHAEPRRLASGAYASPAGADFTGIYAGGGRGWCVETKSAERAVYLSREAARAWGKDRAPALSERQRAQLGRYFEADAVSLLAVEIRGVVRVWQWGYVPWEQGQLDAEAARGRSGWATVREALEALR